MRVRVMGMLDEVIDVDETAYNEAVANEKLSQLMDPILANLSIDITYGKEDEFDDI